MGIRVLYIIGFVMFIGCLWWQHPVQESAPSSQSTKDTVYTVESLRQAQLPSGRRVKVQGIVVCLSVRQTSGSNQPGSGCYLVPRHGDSPLDTGLYIGEFRFIEYLNKRVIVAGEIFYLPPKKPSSKRFILRNTKVLQLLEE